MKAITLIQPWASLIALGEKRIETRSWPTNYRGPIAIHAGKSMPAYARDLCEELEVADLLEEHGLMWEALPQGEVVATAKLLDCIRFAKDTAWIVEEHCAIPHGQWPYLTGQYEYLLGDFSPGRYGFVLEDVRPLPEPIPARGFQGLWDWSTS
jgi:hypothetical protein